MARQSRIYTGEKSAVATPYAKATNQLDLGAGAECHRLQVLARSSEDEGAWGYVVPSKVELSDVDAAAALADASQRVRFFAGQAYHQDLTATMAVQDSGGVGKLDVTFDSNFRFLYFLSSAGTIDLSVIAEKA